MTRPFDSDEMEDLCKEGPEDMAARVAMEDLLRLRCLLDRGGLHVPDRLCAVQGSDRITLLLRRSQSIELPLR